MIELLPTVSLAVSVGALIVSIGSARFARRQVRLAERQHERDFGAAVVAELADFERGSEELVYTLRVTNAGPATAYDVDVSLVEWTDASPLGRIIGRADVSPALIRGEQRTVRLALPIQDAGFDDHGTAIELSCDYYDDNGIRNKRLALVIDDALIHLPPGPTTM